MRLDRRTFLEVGGVTAAMAAASGCGRAANPLSALLEGPATQGFEPPGSDTIDLVTHSVNRLSYGPIPGGYAEVRRLATDPAEAAEAYLEEQLNPERLDDSSGERMFARFEALNEPMGEMFEYKEDYLLGQMVMAALMRAVYSRRQLYEVMVEFWTDHFNIDPSKGDCRWLKAWDDRAVIRRFALGDVGLRERGTIASAIGRALNGRDGAAAPAPHRFPELLRASALSPAMLWYLDGRENRKGHPEDKPNENYARELLELHTLGVQGGYSQQDVMEVARCLTGWTVRGKGRLSKGKVEFEPSLHDDGPKTVLGHRIPSGLGQGDLDRVLEIVSLHPATARHLATKLCRRFISDEPGASTVESVSSAFLRSRGDIRETLRQLFRSEAFRATRGNKFKRPFHFLVSALRATGAAVKPHKELAEALGRMGQVPFHYPTPDGYPSEAAPWMGTLLWRWNFALSLAQGRVSGVRVDVDRLRGRAGGDAGLMAHFLGRLAVPGEVQAYHESGAGLALLLASPAFQRC